VTVVLANSAYRILQTELSDGSDRPSARQLTTLDHPEIGWTDLARGFGVPAARATTGEELLNALQEAHSEPGPQLIEAVL
ncbi:thiamine pyrophosphate-dependent enzyme, partial [Klebsiella pneumoniae]|nr:thiamine pyrophosphate-dependent enzyme [Klebsiella pneumoniae]